MLINILSIKNPYLTFLVSTFETVLWGAFATLGLEYASALQVAATKGTPLDFNWRVEWLLFQATTITGLIKGIGTGIGAAVAQKGNP